MNKPIELYLCTTTRYLNCTKINLLVGDFQLIYIAKYTKDLNSLAIIKYYF